MLFLEVLGHPQKITTPQRKTTTFESAAKTDTLRIVNVDTRTESRMPQLAWQHALFSFCVFIIRASDGPSAGDRACGATNSRPGASPSESGNPVRPLADCWGEEPMDATLRETAIIVQV